MKILNKRLFRDIKQNLIKYSLIFLLFLIGNMIIVSLAASADTVLNAVADLSIASNRENGYFNVFVPLNIAQINELEEHGVELEECFYIEKYDNQTAAKVRIYKNREKINLLQLKSGKKAEKQGEIVLEQHYAEHHNYKVGDYIIIDEEKYKITGLGYTIDYDSIYKEQGVAYPDYITFCVAYVSEEELNTLLKENNASFFYSYRILNSEKRNTKNVFSSKELFDWLSTMKFDEKKIQNTYMKEIIDNTQEFSDSNRVYESGTEEIYKMVFETLNKGIDVKWTNLIGLVEEKDNVRINSFCNDMLINKNCVIPMGVAIFFALSFITAAVAITDIRKEHRIIGTLYALGYNSNQLAIHFVLRPMFCVISASCCGTWLGYLFAHVMILNYISGGAVPDLHIIMKPYLIFYGVGCPAGIAFLVNWGIIKYTLSKPVVKMMQLTNDGFGKISWKTNRINLRFAYQLRLLSRDFLYYLILLISLFITIFMLLFGITIYSTMVTWYSDCDKDINFNNKYYVMFPTEEIPEKGEPAYYEVLEADFELTNEKMQMELIGLQNGNKYFDCHFESLGKKDIIVSTSAMIKFGWEIGDCITLKSSKNKVGYEFIIADTIKYSYGLCAFMEINEMRKLFMKNDDYWNMLFSGTSVNIEPDRIATVLTKEDAVLGAKNRTKSLMGIIYLLSGTGIFIFIGMMYIIISIITDKSEASMILLYIFGYDSKEVRQIYLMNSFFITILSMLISIPISFQIVSGIYPQIIAIVPNGMKVCLSSPMLLLIIIIILFSWCGIYLFMSNKVNSKQGLLCETLRSQE